MADTRIDDELLRLLEAQLAEEFTDNYDQPSFTHKVAVQRQTKKRSASAMVGPTSKQLESAVEIIQFDHMYSKMVPEIGAETDVETCDDNKIAVQSIEDEKLVEVCNLDHEDITALTALDLIDIASQFEQFDELPVLSCFEPELIAKDEKETADEPVQTYSSCSSPFMQMHEELAYNAENEVCCVPSPSSGYNSMSPDTKSFGDDITESFFSLADDENNDYLWQESFTLFPSLNSEY